MLADLLAAIGPVWAWILLGLALAAGELALPGVFLIWLGLGALCTGLATAALGLPWQGQVLAFAALSAAASLAGQRLSRRSPELLHRRGHDLVGTVVVLDAPISDGIGRIRVGDSVWRVTGPDLPAGTRVRVTGLDGATLTVAAA
ncbi:MAG: NfeD family protein [Methylobacterium sp.]|uniref:NfeD family protein n=1 Tax=Methylobacterium sp. TaxID=409 RepID=UPI0025878673|nr:NfeD family protein [Methylobacterium sp.]MBY0298700.1 NfeD family protein [Methylobacterium sp.]